MKRKLQFLKLLFQHPYQTLWMQYHSRNHWLAVTGPRALKFVHYSSIYPTEWRHADLMEKHLSVKTLTPAESFSVKLEALCQEALKTGIPVPQWVEIMRTTALSLQRKGGTATMYDSLISDTALAAKTDPLMVN